MIKYTSWPEKKKPVALVKKQEAKKPEKKIVKEKPIVKEVPIIEEISVEEFLNNDKI